MKSKPRKNSNEGQNYRIASFGLHRSFNDRHQHYSIFTKLKEIINKSIG